MQLFEVEKSSIPSKLLKDKYIVPPFSILDAKSGYWMERKKEWENILQDRTDNVRNITAKGNTCYCNNYANEDAYYGLKSKGTISTFDPFLAEILIKWFSNPGMLILDPFAGGIVRGAVAGILGRNYLGYDISNEQVLHNIKNWELLKDKYSDTTGDVLWVNEDSENMVLNDNQFDMLLTCPPYYDLEVYTDEPNDLSNQKTYEDFINKYTHIIQLCYNKLKDNSFAVIVVAEIRDNNGIMHGFVPDTINAFKQAGFQYYNEMILENRIVSLGVRCPKYFDQSRKVGRHHQNVLVFYKGDTREIENKFGAFNVIKYL
jgi:hypothetical protein